MAFISPGTSKWDEDVLRKLIKQQEDLYNRLSKEAVVKGITPFGKTAAIIDWSANFYDEYLPATPQYSPEVEDKFKNLYKQVKKDLQ